MTKAKTARIRLDDQDALLHGAAERLADFVLRKVGDRGQLRVSDVPAGRRRHAEEILRRTIEASDALKEQVS